MILLLQYTLIFASVLILVALGGCFAEHSGVINLGLEGIMIMGALGGALTMRYVPNTVPAIVMILAVILVSALVGMVYSCLLAVASINFKADQTLVGTALNLLGTAGATVIVKAINTAANPDDVSSIVQYGSAKNALLAPIGSFEFNFWRPWRKARSRSTASAIRSRSRSSSLPRRTRPALLVRSCCRIRRWIGSPYGCPSDIPHRRMSAIWFSPGRASIHCKPSVRCFRATS